MNDIKNSARLIAHTLLSHAKQNEDITDEIILNIIDRVEAINLAEFFISFILNSHLLMGID